MKTNKITPSKIIYTLLSFLISYYFIKDLLPKFDWNRLTIVLQRIQFYEVAIIGITIVFWCFLRAWRWSTVLKQDYSLKCFSFLGPLVASVSLNNVLPFRLGDVIRVFAFQKEIKSTSSSILGSLLIERILDFLSVSLLTITFFAIDKEQLSINQIFYVIAGLIAVLILLKFISKLRLKSSHRIASFINELLNSFSILSSGKILTIITIQSLSIWLLEAVIYAAVGYAWGLKLAPQVFGKAMGIGTLSMLIPSAPGGIGTFEYFVTKMLSDSGAAIADATGCAFLIHATLWLPVTTFGLLWLLVRSIKNFLGSK